MNKKFLSVLFILFIIYSAALIAEIKYTVDGDHLILNYKNIEYKTAVSGNAVMNQISKGGSVFFEVHINPSHSELVIFNLKTKKFTTQIYTQYFINHTADLLTITDPPHFSSTESDLLKEISVNGIPVHKLDRSIEVDVKISPGKFDIYSDGKKTGCVKKSKNKWTFYKF